MSAGDNNFDICPVCKADNLHQTMERFSTGGFEYYMIRCNKCGFNGPHDPTRKGATDLWNLYQRPGRLISSR